MKENQKRKISPKVPGRINIFTHVGHGRKWVAEIGQQCCRAKRAFTSSRASSNLSDVLDDIFLELHLNTNQNVGLCFLLFPL
ncbi:hypothetical protein ALC53_11306 [Atta colombica]|uniref:Uncharacterized protein n=1 Tax=Atta colombica TaxID=520822 RepID=A0A195B1E1_9HYME|nr:hypothetical protein ALC53_11306 [Atta colombica]